MTSDGVHAETLVGLVGLVVGVGAGRGAVVVLDGTGVMANEGGAVVDGGGRVCAGDVVGEEEALLVCPVDLMATKPSTTPTASKAAITEDVSVGRWGVEP